MAAAVCFYCPLYAFEGSREGLFFPLQLKHSSFYKYNFAKRRKKKAKLKSCQSNKHEDYVDENPKALRLWPQCCLDELAESENLYLISLTYGYSLKCLLQDHSLSSHFNVSLLWSNKKLSAHHVLFKYYLWKEHCWDCSCCGSMCLWPSLGWSIGVVLGHGRQQLQRLEQCSQ